MDLCIAGRKRQHQVLLVSAPGSLNKHVVPTVGTSYHMATQSRRRENSEPEQLDDEVQLESLKKRARRMVADQPAVTTSGTFKSLIHKVNLWARQSVSMFGFADARQPGALFAPDHPPWSIPSSRQPAQRNASEEPSSAATRTEGSLPSVADSDEQIGGRVGQFIRALASADRSNSGSDHPGIAPHPNPGLPPCQPLECRRSSESIEPREDDSQAGPPARRRKVKFCDEEDGTLASPVTGIAYPPEWAIAHQRALCAAKHFSILRRVPRRGLLSNEQARKGLKLAPDLLSVRQRYREAYFGLKLWRAHVEGQPWALHDLDGLPAREDGLHSHYAQVAAQLVREHGKLAAKQINEETETEWQSLKAMRQQEADDAQAGSEL
ncbi:hypothetical protein WJX73_005664 [Symbiochloris irregularis]|uniref:Uncharacterized protein n=1 Tax=Symbiochloris irregularis TaxID=706552 RepID=A0AAW1P699_9CHLO